MMMLLLIVTLLNFAKLVPNAIESSNFLLRLYYSSVVSNCRYCSYCCSLARTIDRCLYLTPKDLPFLKQNNHPPVFIFIQAIQLSTTKPLLNVSFPPPSLSPCPLSQMSLPRRPPMLLVTRGERWSLVPISTPIVACGSGCWRRCRLGLRG